jgi:sulfur-oxidizing protein SoxZ
MRDRTHAEREPALVFGPPTIGEAKVLLPLTVERNTVTYVRALLTHPMDTGLFRDAQGVPIPAYFVNDVVVTYGDERVAHFTWSTGISRDPYVSFPLKATHEAPVKVEWKDNKGAVYSQSADLKFTAS